MAKKLRYTKNRRDVDTTIGVIKFKRIPGEGFRIKCKRFPTAHIRQISTGEFFASVSEDDDTFTYGLRANAEDAYLDILVAWRVFYNGPTLNGI